MSSWHSYPSIFALGHRALENLFSNPVLVEEKVDGSQFSFGRFGGELKVRSKGKEMFPDAPEKMFAEAVRVVSSLDLRDGWTYRGEYLQKPKHNCIAYTRVPNNHVIIFDINTDHEQYLGHEEKAAEAARIGLEVVPVMFFGMVDNPSMVQAFLERDSVLGGSKIEGVVLKNYSQFGADKKVLMGKYVSESFKEVHKKEWGENNPKQGDIVVRLITMLKTEARWSKAVQHLAERGELENSPRDIGKLFVEVKKDIKKECKDEIKDVLYAWAIDAILRGSCGGLPEWYKNRLLESQFKSEESASCAQDSAPENPSEARFTDSQQLKECHPQSGPASV